MNSEKNSKKNVKKSKKNPLFHNFCYDFVKITGAPAALIWMRPKIHYPFGRPSKKGGFMVISNHPTFVDPIVVHLAFPFRRMYCVATKDLCATPLRRMFFKIAHCIIVDKENFSLSSFHEVVGRLEQGKVVVIFPEGRVNREADSEPLLAFKSGAVLMAHRASAPILPMFIVKNDKWYKRQHIVMGQPLDIASIMGKMPTMEEMNKVTDLLREKEEELKEYYESQILKNHLIKHKL